MRSRGTKRRPGAAEWASCLRVDSALTAWLQTVHSGCRVAQAPFGAAERGFCQAAQGCATWIINYKCFRKAHTCKGHRSQSQHFFFSFHGRTERGIPSVVLFGSFRDLILHSDPGASQRYSKVAKLGATVAGSASKCQGIDVQLTAEMHWIMNLWRAREHPPKFNPIWSYLMYSNVLYIIYLSIFIIFIIQIFFPCTLSVLDCNKLRDLTSGSDLQCWGLRCSELSIWRQADWASGIYKR